MLSARFAARHLAVCVTLNASPAHRWAFTPPTRSRENGNHGETTHHGERGELSFPNSLPASQQSFPLPRHILCWSSNGALLATAERISFWAASSAFSFESGARSSPTPPRCVRWAYPSPCHDAENTIFFASFSSSPSCCSDGDQAARPGIMGAGRICLPKCVLLPARASDAVGDSRLVSIGREKRKLVLKASRAN